jgi:hypothetical protein
MEINAIALDENMARIILSAFCSEAYDGRSSLVPNYSGSKHQFSAKEIAKLEFRILDAINSVHPEIVAEYFDIEKQMEYKSVSRGGR